jgi:queuine tRNA-ribosyltransferase
VTDDGVRFESHIDGSPMLLTPECVVEAQERLGADLIMPLDECIDADASRAESERALEHTQTWYQRSVAVHRREEQALFALVQGGLFADLRVQGARAAAASRSPGFAIGGLSVGEPKDVTAALLKATLAELPAERPRYLMGVGHPADLATYARLGVDLFDCVLPTRLGRNGTVWTDFNGTRLDLNRRAALADGGPIRPECQCPACRDWSVGSLAAMFQAHEQLAFRLASGHNLRVLADVLDDARQQVLYTA